MLLRRAGAQPLPAQPDRRAQRRDAAACGPLHPRGGDPRLRRRAHNVRAAPVAHGGKDRHKPITSSFHCQAENVTAHFLCKDSAAINRGVYRACYQMVYQYSDIIHYPTQFIRDTFEAVVGPTNGRVISNGVNSMFTPGPATRFSSSRPAVCRAKRIRRSSSRPSAARPTASRSTSSLPEKARVRRTTVTLPSAAGWTWRSRSSRGRSC